MSTDFQNIINHNIFLRFFASFYHMHMIKFVPEFIIHLLFPFPFSQTKKGNMSKAGTESKKWHMEKKISK